MLERVVILLGVVTVLTLTVVVARAWARWQARWLLAVPGSVLLHALEAESDGRPSIVTFSTPSCAACYTAQAPAVEHVARQLGADNLRIFRVDAASRPEIARTFGVLTVPSSVVLDANGRITAVNHGFAPSQKLIQQLQTA